MKNAVIVEGIRTPFSTYGGSLKNYHPEDLATEVIKSVVERSGIDSSAVQKVVIGNALMLDGQGVFLPRHITLKAGLQQSTPAVGTSCLCGTGVNAVALAAMEIMLERAEVLIAGGTECMDQLPYHVRNVRWGPRPGNIVMEDLLFGENTIFYDNIPGVSQGQTAENLVEKYSISRVEQDEYALRSHELALRAQENGRLAQEILPLTIKEKKETFVLDRDEGPRQTSMEKLSKLRPVFKKDGTVTAGNASGINNGAGALLVTSDEWAKQNGYEPIARVVDWEMVGVDPAYMGIGPVYAIRGLLNRCNLSLDKIDLIELNEAFAGQYLACEKELGLDRNKVNVNGGAIAIGHPIAATGIRLVLTLALELRNRGLRYGIATMCIGGGQGMAMLLENTSC